ncbi:hypothetical protein ACFL1P_00870 [Patescibacteria group bacterium]
MKFIKKYWYISLLTIGTIGLGVITLLTSMRLQQTKPLQEAPHASTVACTLEFTVDELSDCSLTFNLDVTATPTPTPGPQQCNGDCGSNIDCEAGYVCETGSCRNPSCVDAEDCVCVTPTNTPTPTPVPVGCNEGCYDDTDCTGSMICNGGFCRNPSCTAEPDCACPTATPIPTVPVTNTNTPTPIPRCSDACVSNADCPSDLICSDGMCRNPSCTAEADCSCTEELPPPPDTPQIPVSGAGPGVIGLAVIAGGALLLLLGLAF